MCCRLKSHVRLNPVLPKLFFCLLSEKGFGKKTGAWIFYFTLSPLTYRIPQQPFFYCINSVPGTIFSLFRFYLVRISRLELSSNDCQIPHIAYYNHDYHYVYNFRFTLGFKSSCDYNCESCFNQALNSHCDLYLHLSTLSAHSSRRCDCQSCWSFEAVFKIESVVENT